LRANAERMAEVAAIEAKKKALKANLDKIAN